MNKKLRDVRDIEGLLKIDENDHLPDADSIRIASEQRTRIFEAIHYHLAIENALKLSIKEACAEKEHRLKKLADLLVASKAILCKAISEDSFRSMIHWLEDNFQYIRESEKVTTLLPLFQLGQIPFSAIRQLFSEFHQPSLQSHSIAFSVMSENKRIAPGFDSEAFDEHSCVSVLKSELMMEEEDQLLE